MKAPKGLFKEAKKSLMKNPLQFLGEVKQELHKVQWPTKTQTMRYSLLVVAISIAVAIYLGVLDYFFAFVLKQFV